MKKVSEMKKMKGRKEGVILLSSKSSDFGEIVRSIVGGIHQLMPMDHCEIGLYLSHLKDIADAIGHESLPKYDDEFEDLFARIGDEIGFQWMGVVDDDLDELEPYTFWVRKSVLKTH